MCHAIGISLCKDERDEPVWEECHTIGVSYRDAESVHGMYVWDMCHIIGVSY